MISAVILTKNEEKNIVDCIESLKGFDEILVIDDNSDDRTREIAKNLGATVFEHPLDNNFSNQRNFGLEKAKGEWVLFVDADERVTPELKKEIILHAANPGNPYTGFYLKRRDILFGKELQYGEVGNIQFLRFAQKHRGKWEGAVHEEWKVKGKIGKLNNNIVHYPHQNIAEFLREINFYTTIRAKELYEKKTKVNAFSIILYPKAKFFLGYILKQGFRDGIPGLVFALLMSFHSFLVRGKLWLLWNKK